MAKLSAYDAREILRQCTGSIEGDFHRLNSEQVNALLAHADKHGYRKLRNANGSRGRYWHAHLQRVANRESDQ